MAEFLESAVGFYSSSVGRDFARSVEKESSSVFYSVMVELNTGINWLMCHTFKSSVHRQVLS